MAIEAPRLDDRSFQDIVDEARARIALYAPEWTDHNLSDPGITLIELFAWMTDIVLYRLNRVPDKHFIKFMELIGMQLHSGTPAQVEMTFWLSAPQPNALTIPSGTEVATTRTETEPAIVFTTDGDLQILVPELDYLLTYSETNDGPTFNPHDVVAAQAALTTFPVFASETPRVNDSLYIGFDKDLSKHILGVTIEVDTAEGAGVHPDHPPYVWEVLDSGLEPQWREVMVEQDTTRGLNVNGTIRVYLPTLRQSVRNDITAYWLRLRLKSAESDNRYDVSPKIRRLRVESWGGTVGATNVSRVKEEVVGRSEGTPGQRFYLEHIPVVARMSDEYIRVRLDNGIEQRWQEVTDFASSDGTDRHYTIDNETGEIRFGPAIPQPDGQVRRYGQVPPANALIIMNGYRYGGGLVGNVAARSIDVLRSSIPYVDRVLNLVPARGGMDAESLDNAKMRVPGHLRSLQRAVTAADFEYLTREAAPGEVGRVYCLQPPLTNRGENRVLVIPHIPVLRGFIAPEGLVLSADVRDTIQAYLDERRLLSTRLEVTTPAYVWVETEVRIHPSQHADVEKVRRAVEARLFTFLNPLIGGFDGKGWPFGRDLLISDLMAVLTSVEGVNFVRGAKLFPITYENRQFLRGDEVEEISLPSHGVVVSYQHTVIIS